MLLVLNTCRCPIVDTIVLFRSISCNFISSFGQYFLILDGIIQFWKLLSRFVGFDAILDKEKPICIFRLVTFSSLSEAKICFTEKEKYLSSFNEFSSLKEDNQL